VHDDHPRPRRTLVGAAATATAAALPAKVMAAPLKNFTRIGITWDGHQAGGDTVRWESRLDGVCGSVCATSGRTLN
jgi:hypothetical protein